MSGKFWAKTPLALFLLVVPVFLLLLHPHFASAAEARADIWRQDVLENTLGKQTNKTLGVTDTNLSEWVGNVVQFSIINGMTLLAGKDVLVGGKISGVLGATMAMTTGILENQPNLETFAYLKRSLANNILSPQPVYAATGAKSLEAVMGIWSAMRNIAYGLTVVILVVIGFMVMFRYQTDPRTVITFVSALPRIIISLVLITFSYPLAGFIIDLGRVLKSLIDASFGSIAGFTLTPLEPFQVMRRFIMVFSPLQVLDAKTILLGHTNIYIGGTGITSAFISLVVTIVAVVVAFILFFTLIFRYAAIFIQVIFAPLAFLWGALPGQEDTITGWFKSFVVNVVCFPVIYLMINLAVFIAGESPLPGHAVPLPTELGWGTLFGGGVGDIGGLVAFGLVVAATQVPSALEDALAVRRPAPGGVEPMKIAAKIPVIGGLFK